MAIFGDPILDSMAYQKMLEDQRQPSYDLGPPDYQWAPPDSRQGEGSVSRILDYFQRPQYAATALFDPEESLGGVWRGLTGQYRKTPADLFGMEEGTGDDDWGTWLGKEIPRFGVNAIADPLLFLPVGKIGKAAGLGKAADWAVSNTKIGRELHRAFGHGSTPEVQAALDEMSRRLGRSKQEVMEQVLTSRKALGDADEAALREMWERGGGQIPDELRAAWEAQHGSNRAATEELNAILQARGMKPIPFVDESGEQFLERWVPRPTTEKGQRYLSSLERQQSRIPSIRLSPEEFDPRELMRVVDPESFKQGKIINPAPGAPAVTKLEYLDELPGGGYQYKGVPAAPIHSTLGDIEQAAAAGGLGKNFKPGMFVKGVGESYGIDQMRKVGQTEYVRFIDALENVGQIRKLKGGEIPAQGKMRLKVPGFGDYEAPVKVANHLANLAKQQWDPTTPVGAVGELLEVVGKSALGRVLKDANRWFKNSVLPLSPSWVFGNMATNAGVAYLNSVPLHEIPILIKDAMVVGRGAGETLKRIPNSWLKTELTIRGVGQSGLAAEMAGGLDPLQAARKSGRTQEILGNNIVGRTAQKVGDVWGAVNRKGFEVAGSSWMPMGDEASRIGMAVRWLKKNHPDLAKYSPDDQAKILDQAARHAKDAMIDFSQMTPTERNISNLVAPFYGWTRGITGKLAETAVERPERLARMGRALDTVFDPMSEQDKALADPWVQEGSPVTGAFGQPFDTIQGMPGVRNIARFLPTGIAEQYANRPYDAAISSVSPFLKGPVEATMNWSSFKDRPIDPIAGSFGAGLVNPIVGGPYQNAGGQIAGENIPAAWDYALQGSPASAAVRNVNRMGQTAGLWEDKYRPIEDVTGGLENTLIGGRAYGYDRAKYTLKRQRDYNLLLKDLRSQIRYAQSKGDYEAVMQYQEQYNEATQRPRVWLGR